MKTILTVEESRRLIDLGVDPKLASATRYTISETEEYCGYKREITVTYGYINNYLSADSIFTLADILSILPKEIEDSNLDIISTQVDIKNHKKVSGWIATYIDSHNDLAFGNESVFQSPELIDALNQLLIWCLESKIKLKED